MKSGMRTKEVQVISCVCVFANMVSVCYKHGFFNMHLLTYVFELISIWIDVLSKYSCGESTL